MLHPNERIRIVVSILLLHRVVRRHICGIIMLHFNERIRIADNILLLHRVESESTFGMIVLHFNERTRIFGNKGLLHHRVGRESKVRIIMLHSNIVVLHVRVEGKGTLA